MWLRWWTPTAVSEGVAISDSHVWPENSQRNHHHHHHHHLEIYSAPITFVAIGAVQKSYEQQQTLTNVKSKGKIMGF